MSSTFDTMQFALEWLGAKLEDDAQAQDVIFYFKQIVDKFHDYCHTVDPYLNQVAGAGPAQLETALKYEDDAEREFWLSTH